ncbi:protein-glutamine gamma-glutamyltransferase E [Microcaecilia unicolor]|uniref:Protein-glutamine gamma-glutamyltransferase E-like n=1 Tax=Microcaecilia unicolor TaxID=1415580 RepID=A0A6P7YWN0_9AMPH|nr:protein-glutamine gamma-glutamyltransferase E-like [Microcaecilia unicolor]XP_030069361.1 protein-glutamine gamma-glutamyltransferase E-like [Microcaecilia unicolor]XP_030069362.1 protein-glutamine gamma-glutamyltransferase E-like [Microcaecilia unicolor]XP_030069363.1 protein-glutamine gamma-glutamyltransferase E-like [Microcaecilia unicolor]XP_030069365.1 protein-glutamine gamma-glutamyltransferase E-like [Microcaecilia unicolor]
MEKQRAHYRPLCQNASISGTIKLKGPLTVGQDISVILILKNVTDAAKTTQLNITAHSTLYTKRPVHELFKETRTVTFGPNEEKEIPLDIEYSKYEDYLTSDNMVEVKVVCLAERQGDAAIVHRDIVLDNPKLNFKVCGKAMVNKTMTVEVSFENPLLKEVSGGVLRAEGSGLIKDQVVMQVGCVKPKETLTIPVKITPYRCGNRQLLVDFTCSKFTNVKGFCSIQVEPNGLSLDN